MKYTVATKIWIGCLIIVGLGTVAMFTVYWGLLRVRHEMRRLAEVTEPTKSAASELEINTKGMAIGTMGYLSSPNPVLWALVENNEADFQQFHADYLRLAVTEEELVLGRAIGELFEQFRARARGLKDLRDRQARDFSAVMAKLREIDRLLDQDLRSTLDPFDPNDLLRLECANSVEADIAEIGMHVASYGWLREAGAGVFIVQKIEECRKVFGQLQDFTWSGERQGSLVRSLRDTFEDAMRSVHQVLSQEDEIQKGSSGFIALREEMDTLLDEKIQPLAVTLLKGPRRRAEGAAVATLIQIIWLIPVFIVFAALASLALTRALTTPLRSLARGTEVVSRGDLSYRAPLVSNDEFAILARAFNSMVARLQETLVSKEMLERSQEELKCTVEALQQEISERMRAEEERMQLQATLRREQTLSAMGTLVAGVAHQVRNPLFGISSILDAMEARLGQREEYRPYLSALRDPANRLNTLMRELMDYGRQGDVEREPGSLGDLIRLTAKEVQGVRERQGVGLDVQVDDDLPPIHMDRPSLGRALENLLENALQHSPRGGTVTISAREVEQEGARWVEVLVEDHGPGFQERDLPCLFEPFHSRREGGIGLGMAVARRIVESHCGLVTAGNRPGGGGLLTVRLPVEANEARTPGALAQSPGANR